MNEFERALEIVETYMDVPDVVYHGTDHAPFDSFKQVGGKISTIFGSEDVERSGFFFTPDKELASRFGKNVMSARLHIRKVADLTDDGFDNRIMKQWEETGHNYKWLMYKETWELFDGEDGKEWVKFLQEMGYDGAVMDEPAVEGDDTSGLAYIVFDPKDIEILKWYKEE
jgi:hypothetical protein